MSVGQSWPGALGPGEERGLEGLLGPSCCEGLTEQVGLGPGREAADRLVTVEVGGKGVALGGGRDDVAQVAVAGSGRRASGSSRGSLLDLGDLHRAVLSQREGGGFGDPGDGEGVVHGAR